MHPTTIIRQQLIQSLVSLICASDLVEAVVVHGVYVDVLLKTSFVKPLLEEAITKLVRKGTTVGNDDDDDDNSDGVEDEKGV